MSMSLNHKYVYLLLATYSMVASCKNKNSPARSLAEDTIVARKQSADPSHVTAVSILNPTYTASPWIGQTLFASAQLTKLDLPEKDKFESKLSDKYVVWSSSNSKVIAIDKKTGFILPRSLGTATIKVEYTYQSINLKSSREITVVADKNAPKLLGVSSILAARNNSGIWSIKMPPRNSALLTHYGIAVTVASEKEPACDVFESNKETDEDYATIKRTAALKDEDVTVELAEIEPSTDYLAIVCPLQQVNFSAGNTPAQFTRSAKGTSFPLDKMAPIPSSSTTPTPSSTPTPSPSP